jgi:hypothetical protein
MAGPRGYRAGIVLEPIAQYRRSIANYIGPFRHNHVCRSIAESQPWVACKGAPGGANGVAPPIERWTRKDYGHEFGRDLLGQRKRRGRAGGVRRIDGLGLVEETPSEELEKKNANEKRDYGFAIHLTPLGHQTQAFLRSVVAQFVQQVSRPQPETPAQE